jgi:hypothetical protein
MRASIELIHTFILYTTALWNEMTKITISNNWGYLFKKKHKSDHPIIYTELQIQISRKLMCTSIEWKRALNQLIRLIIQLKISSIIWVSVNLVLHINIAKNSFLVVVRAFLIS